MNDDAGTETVPSLGDQVKKGSFMPVKFCSVNRNTLRGRLDNLHHTSNM